MKIIYYIKSKLVSIKINSTNPRAIVTIGTSRINSVVVTTKRYTYSFALNTSSTSCFVFSVRANRACMCADVSVQAIESNALTVCDSVWMCVCVCLPAIVGCECVQHQYAGKECVWRNDITHTFRNWWVSTKHGKRTAMQLVYNVHVYWAVGWLVYVWPMSNTLLCCVQFRVFLSPSRCWFTYFLSTRLLSFSNWLCFSLAESQLQRARYTNIGSWWNSRIFAVCQYDVDQMRSHVCIIIMIFTRGLQRERQITMCSSFLRFVLHTIAQDDEIGGQPTSIDEFNFR